jgi:hypothetical protein
MAHPITCIILNSHCPSATPPTLFEEPQIPNHPFQWCYKKKAIFCKAMYSIRLMYCASMLFRRCVLSVSLHSHPLPFTLFHLHTSHPILHRTATAIPSYISQAHISRLPWQSSYPKHISLGTSCLSHSYSPSPFIALYSLVSPLPFAKHSPFAALFFTAVVPPFVNTIHYLLPFHVSSFSSLRSSSKIFKDFFCVFKLTLVQFKNLFALFA